MHQPTTAPAPPRILLAEEQTVSRDLVVRALGKLGYPIEPVSTARDVLERAGSTELLLILLSTSLADDPRFLEAIRAWPGAGAVPVAMIGPPAGVSNAYRAAGAIDYFGRPIDIERLLLLVERTAHGRSAIPEHDGDGEPVLDLDHLFTFTDGDPQLEDELLALFLSTAELYLASMSEALHSGESWSASAHALKGASANLGARRVMALALAAERLPPAQAQLEALRQAIDQVRACARHRPG